MTGPLVRILCIVATVSVVALATVGNSVAAGSSVREALGQAIRINAEAKAEMAGPLSIMDKLTGHKSPDADSNSVAPAAKTKSFAYTSISVPSVQ
jgi:hypothetical protein